MRFDSLFKARKHAMAFAILLVVLISELPLLLIKDEK